MLRSVWFWNKSMHGSRPKICVDSKEEYILSNIVIKHPQEAQLHPIDNPSIKDSSGKEQTTWVDWESHKEAMIIIQLIIYSWAIRPLAIKAIIRRRLRIISASSTSRKPYSTLSIHATSMISTLEPNKGTPISTRSLIGWIVKNLPISWRLSKRNQHPLFLIIANFSNWIPPDTSLLCCPRPV